MKRGKRLRLTKRLRNKYFYVRVSRHRLYTNVDDAYLAFPLSAAADLIATILYVAQQ